MTISVSGVAAGDLGRLREERAVTRRSESGLQPRQRRARRSGRPGRGDRVGVVVECDDCHAFARRRFIDGASGQIERPCKASRRPHAERAIDGDDAKR